MEEQRALAGFVHELFEGGYDLDEGIAIARALMLDPRLMLFDEVTSADVTSSYLEGADPDGR
ncbi:hypothetical protein VB636_00080 [Paracoccus sp. APAP_BH8]|uniref:hypothetical protein n=1 Tax=Paracoccus sp. APAP_BH8 TaxID=3110237 RepID=UPI002FD7F717